MDLSSDRDRTDLLRTAGRVVLVAFLLGLGGGDVLADDGRRGLPNERGAMSSFSKADTIRAPKRVDLATLYGVGGTLLPVVGGTVLLDRANGPYAYTRKEPAGLLGAASLTIGLLVGPSLGHFYAQNRGQAWTGMAVRGGALAGGTLALSAIPLTIEGISPGKSETKDRPAVRGVLAGVVIAFAGTLLFRSFYDLASTPRAVRVYNAQSDVRARVLPRVSATGKSAGFTLRLQF